MSFITGTSLAVILICLMNSNAGQNTASSLLPKDCGSGPGSDRIVGGTESSLDASPWMVLIEYEDRSKGGLKPLCGGSLISAKYVVTAAHCITVNTDAYSLPKRVRLGEHDLRTEVDCRTVDREGNQDCNDPPVFVDVESSTYHPKFNVRDKSRQNDIGLLRLAKAVKWTYFISPICLPASATARPASSNVFSSGWGLTENKTSSSAKLEIGIMLVERDACQYAYNRFKVTLTEGQICAGGQDGIDTCRGDSGGPLTNFASSTQTWQIVGIVSFGPSKCGTFGIPGVYTNVAYFVNWIISQLKP